MALQLGALREALLEAGASEGKAAAAAEEVATYERDMADLRSDVRLLKWMLGVNLGLVAAVLGSQAAVWIKLGEMGGQLAAIAHAIK